MQTREADFEQLLEYAAKLHREGCFTVAVRTTEGHLYHALTPIDPLDLSGENAMIQEMADRGDTQVKRIVCLHSPGCAGVVSGNLRLKLRSLNTKNMEAEILLQGKEPGTYGFRTFDKIFPPTE